MNNSEIDVIVIGSAVLISVALIVLWVIAGIETSTTENISRSLMSGSSRKAEASKVSVRKPSLGFRIFAWTIPTIIFVQVAAVIWPVVVDPVVYILRYSLGQLFELELHWRRLQPMTRSVIMLIAMLMIFAPTLARATRRPTAGDGSEEHF